MPSFPANRSTGLLYKSPPKGPAFTKPGLPRRLAHLGIDARLNATVPVNIEEIARLVGATTVRKADIPAAGMLIPVNEEFVILLNKDDVASRQRFSCAHEIAHTLLGYQPPSASLRQLPLLPSNHKERECENLAAMLLMPNPAFEDRANTLPPSIKSIVNLSRMFMTSVQATAIRFVDVLTKPSLLIVSTFRNGSSGRTLRVKWSHQNTHRPDGRPKYFVPRKASLKLQTASIAYRTDQVQRDTEDIKIGRLRLRGHTESRGFGYGDRRYVLTLVFPTTQTVS